MNKSELKDRLKEAMDIRGLKQADIVEKGKIDKGQLSSWLSGKYKPRQNNISKLSEILSVDEAWLMGYDVPMERTKSDELLSQSEHCNNDNRKLYTFDSSESALIYEYRKMNNAGKDKLISTAREMNCSPLYNDNYQEELLAAHRRTDVEYSEEGMKHDLDIMSDENF